MYEKQVRLSKEEIQTIKEVAKEVFGKDVRVFIFGSRVFLEKRGGDKERNSSKIARTGISCVCKIMI